MAKKASASIRTVAQDELPSLAKAARGHLTQAEAAEQLGVNQANISKAENDPTGRYLSLQRRMIEELGGWRLRGPLWEVNQTSSNKE